jgi:hypothetical protein
MPAIRTPRIVRPGVLSNLKPSSITALLSPFADYFAARGAPLDQIGSSDLALEAVVSVIASPIESTPSELVERFELLDLISDPQSGINFEDGYEVLVARHLEGDDTAEDLAVKILIHAPDVAWREFDRQALQAKRSLVSYASNPSLTFQPPTARRVTQLENLLRPWFEQNARSGICRVHVREENDGTSFVIRHGDLLKRIGVFDENGSPSSKILRPERVDVAHYRTATQEWQISGVGRRLQELYAQAFGAVFHSSASAFVPSHRYSLEPLREGPAILSCDPQSRVQFAHLASLKLELPGGTWILLGRGDIFTALAEMNPSLLQTVTLLEARIDLKLAGRRRLVPVVLNPVRDKISGVHLDPTIEPWLAERGFSHADHETLFLESA